MFLEYGYLSDLPEPDHQTLRSLRLALRKCDCRAEGPGWVALRKGKKRNTALWALRLNCTID